MNSIISRFIESYKKDPNSLPEGYKVRDVDSYHKSIQTGFERIKKDKSSPAHQRVGGYFEMHKNPLDDGCDYQKVVIKGNRPVAYFGGEIDEDQDELRELIIVPLSSAMSFRLTLYIKLWLHRQVKFKVVRFTRVIKDANVCRMNGVDEYIGCQSSNWRIRRNALTGECISARCDFHFLTKH